MLKVKNKLSLSNLTKRYFNTIVSTKQGLFGLNIFKSKTTITDSSKNLIERSKYNFDLLTKMDKDIRMIELYDKISNDLCTLIDGATVLYHIHNNEDIKNSSYEAIVAVGELFEQFNHNAIFYSDNFQIKKPLPGQRASIFF